MIAEHGDLDGVYGAIASQTPRLRENLAAHREQVFLNRDLMHLVDNLELGINISDLHIQDWDRKEVRELFDSLEFHSMWTDLEQALPSARSVSEVLDVETRMATRADLDQLALSDTLVTSLVVDGEIRLGWLARWVQGKRWSLRLTNLMPFSTP